MKKILLTIITFLFSYSVFSQVTVTGVIKDEQNNPLPGVSVIIKNTTRGITTDMDGKYSISANPQDTLTFSMIGMETINVPVGTQTTIDLTMKEHVTTFENVVIVGYGTQRSRDLTAPIQTVKSEEIARQATANPAQALQGRVAGVTVINSGEPGSQPIVQIRGVGSALAQGIGPLYVVDGTIVHDISFLSNDAIESITVLKDASAAAIYGVQAANGVILVTTKKGKSGAPTFNVSHYSGLQHPTNILQMSDNKQYIELLNQRSGLTGTGGTFDPAAYPVSTNWYDVLAKDAYISNTDLNVSGGTDKSIYSFGASYFDQDGIINTSNSKNKNTYNRISFRAKNDFTFNKYLQAGFNIILSRSHTVPGYNYAFYQAYVAPPAFAPKAADGTFTNPLSLGFSGPFANPAASVYYYRQDSNVYEIVPGSYISILPVTGLTIKTNFSADLVFNHFRSYTPVYYVSGLQNNLTSSFKRNLSATTNFIWDNTLEYEKKMGNHYFKFLAGTSYQQNFSNKISGTAYNVPDVSDATLYLSRGDESTRIVSDEGIKDRVQSYFSRINYNFADKYLLTATIRADGSSRYNIHWGYFPSVGIGWVLSEESFMKKQSFFNFLKIRASWGMLGNNHVPSNSLLFLSSSGADQTGIFGGNIAVPGITFQTVYKDTLKWETVTELDGGLEFQMFNRRLDIEIDYYNRLTSNAVFLRPIATASGTGFLLANNGKIRNQGVEINAGWEDKKKNGKLGYSIHGNLTTISNKVVEIASESGEIFGGSLNGSFITRTVVGKPIGSFYGYKQAGVFQSNADVDNYIGPDGTVLQPDAIPGDLKFADVSPGKGITNEDRTILGNPIPKITFGLDAGLTFANWDLNVSFQGVAGNEIFNQKRADRNPFPDANFDYNFYKNHWKGAGSSNTYPSAALSRRNIQPNSFFVESGTYVRIRNVQLGYTLPKEKLKAMQLRIYVTAQNPVTIFNYNGYTPEIGGTSPIEMGIDSQTYPVSAVYSLGLNFTF